ncbi:hypothetical protein DNI29_22435 [Hymenobacter sediminis]|uniref:hypothetical protein n=1 Tax=Hymenobacter sediminis TaxID=2218621 RepID=UPI000DA6AFCE|nr:hypothetical protein [Hymenobacter sediminis]RPD44157.1 hypothetical protein DNI29_22435 [Hymenobacter sediminis]
MHALRYFGPATAQLQPGHTYPIVLTMTATQYWVHLEGKPLHSFSTLQQLLDYWAFPGFKRPVKPCRPLARA